VTPPRRRYRTDLTDAQWQVLGPLIPQPNTPTGDRDLAGQGGSGTVEPAGRQGGHR
jgi:transposase